jgi:hypothetical protein
MCLFFVYLHECLCADTNEFMENQSTELQQFILENANLFWWVPENKLQDLTAESLVEGVLNFGDIQSVKKLFAIFSVHRVAEIFYQQLKRKRHNYYPQTKHYFTLYFQKYA